MTPGGGRTAAMRGRSTPGKCPTGALLEEMAAYASATFWPRGAIRAAVAGAVGGLLAVGAWLIGIPLLSGVLVLIGGFLFEHGPLPSVSFDDVGQPLGRPRHWRGRHGDWLSTGDRGCAAGTRPVAGPDGRRPPAWPRRVRGLRPRSDRAGRRGRWNRRGDPLRSARQRDRARQHLSWRPGAQVSDPAAARGAWWDPRLTNWP